MIQNKFHSDYEIIVPSAVSLSNIPVYKLWRSWYPFNAYAMILLIELYKKIKTLLNNNEFY